MVCRVTRTKPSNNSLSHSGKKGMKWGFNDGEKNGKRTAGDKINDAIVEGLEYKNKKVYVDETYGPSGVRYDKENRNWVNRWSSTFSSEKEAVEHERELDRINADILQKMNSEIKKYQESDEYKREREKEKKMLEKEAKKLERALANPEKLVISGFSKDEIDAGKESLDRILDEISKYENDSKR